MTANLQRIPVKLVKFRRDRRGHALYSHYRRRRAGGVGRLRRFCSLRFRRARQSNNF